VGKGIAAFIRLIPLVGLMRGRNLAGQEIQGTPR
jgi:hypothetical protein